jgi:hypothetical protein
MEIIVEAVAVIVDNTTLAACVKCVLAAFA